MTNNVFFARGDSSSANNSALNAEGTNKTPVTQLEFQAAPGGNLELEYNGGLADPDTVVLVDGVEMDFTVEFSGTLPFSNKLSNVNGQDLRGEAVTVITTEDGQRYFFLNDANASAATMGAFPNGAHSIENVDTTTTVPVCFTRGTMIATPNGPVAIEALRQGDFVQTAAGDVAMIEWITSSSYSRAQLHNEPRLRPYIVAPHALGPGQPSSGLSVSPQHCLVMGGWQTELLLGQPAVLVRAKHLDGFITRRDNSCAPVEYFHLLCAHHELVVANGLATESFQPDLRALQALGPSALAAFRARFSAPETRRLLTRPTALPVLKRAEAVALASACSMLPAA